MPIQHSLWTVGENPSQLRESKLDSEYLLHQMILTAPTLLSPDWMLIGSEQAAPGGGRFDLLALAPDASLILIELKRDRTPRQVVAQALDYASWVETLQAADIAAIYDHFRPGRDLAQDFAARFGRPLDDDELNQGHEIVIVAAELDASSERIVEYLNGRGLAINVLFFRIFDHGGQKLLSRAWLVDPGEASDNKDQNPQHKLPWNGEYYVSYGAGAERSWEEARRYGFICGGGGLWYSRTLQMLQPGDRVWVNVPGTGYVGVGRVIGRRRSADDFTVTDDEGLERPALDVLTEGGYHRQYRSDPEMCEYFVPVRWDRTLPIEQAIRRIGLFGNQNTVAAPRTPSWRTTVEALMPLLLTAKATADTTQAETAEH